MAPIRGYQSSSTRAEILGAILSLLAPLAVHLALDNINVVRQAVHIKQLTVRKGSEGLTLSRPRGQKAMPLNMPHTCKSIHIYIIRPNTIHLLIGLLMRLGPNSSIRISSI
eukprot:12420327-Karenia_brevis.AAC.1